MKNIEMGHDSRSIANFILDLCDAESFEVSNMGLNKIIFFAHSDLIVSQEEVLVKSTFEAWQHGPVLPVIYHEFKCFAGSPITSRAKKLCRYTGEKVVAKYDDLLHLKDFLKSCVFVYARMSASQLRALSHEKDGAWDIVWNSSETNNLGMRIPNKLIFQRALHNLTGTEQNNSVN